MRSERFLTGLSLVALAASALLAGATEARTLRVPAAPGAAQQALLAASAGDTVQLLRGTHPGPLRVTQALVLQG